MAVKPIDISFVYILETQMRVGILARHAASFFVYLSLASAQPNQATTPTPPSDTAELKQEIEQVEALMPTLPDRGAALFLLAHDYARMGNTAEALSSLKQCIQLEEGFDPEGDPAFEPLRSAREFQELVERVHGRYPAVHHAHVAFSVKEKDLIPEGLAVDRKSSRLYMGSLNLRKIVKITTSGDVSDFVRAGQYKLGPICGLKVDGGDASLWANTCPDNGVGAELLHFDRTGRLTERFSPPTSGQHLFNDLVLRGKDEIYLTDSLANRVYRFDHKSHRFSEVRLARGIYYPNGIALSDDGNLLYVADAFGILQINLRDGNTQEVDSGRSNTISGADGLYWYRNSLIAIQNSLGSSRVAQFRLSPDGLRVTAVITLEYRSPLVALPTTGAIHGSMFYFMSNTQVDNFKDNKIVDPAKLESVRISVVQLQH